MNSPTICYLCGNSLGNKASRDHVPPRQFFAKEVRRKGNCGQLLTLPCHAACNGSYQKDEDYIVMSLAPLARATPAGKALWSDIAGTSKRPQGQKLLRRVLREFTDRSGSLYLPAGLVRKNTDRARSERVMWKIARGLYFHRTGQFVPEMTPIHLEICQEPADITRPARRLFEIIHSRHKWEGPCLEAFGYVILDETRTGARRVWCDFLLWQHWLVIVMFETPRPKSEAAQPIEAPGGI